MLKLLLVDDSRVMRRLLRNTLAAGYGDCEFVEAVDGEDALRRLEEISFGVDAIFCDLCMPRLDGSGFIRALSEKGVLADLPVIVCTGDIREAQGREALGMGARKLIAKPFTVESVVGALKEVLQGRPAR